MTGPAVTVSLRLAPELKMLVENLAVQKHRSRNAQIVRLIEIGYQVTMAQSPHEAAQVWSKTEDP